MKSSTKSEANVPKLLRTLTEYKADLVMIPTDRSVRMLHEGEWKELSAHPVLSADELREHIIENFGQDFWDDLENGVERRFDYNGSFLFQLEENRDGLLLTVERLKPLSKPEDWPEGIHSWLHEGGLLEIRDPALYASLFRYMSEQSTANLVSLERKVKYPAHSIKGLIHQRELGDHFLSVEDGLKDALRLKPLCIGFHELPLNPSHMQDIIRLAEEMPVILLR